MYILWHPHPLLGNDREIRDYKIAIARQRLRQQMRMQQFNCNKRIQQKWEAVFPTRSVSRCYKRDKLVMSSPVLGETSASEGRKPRPALLSWPSVGAPGHHEVLNNQPRTLKTKEMKEEFFSLRRVFPGGTASIET
jgi:hypothetical protein